MMNTAILNSKECPSFYDLKGEAEKGRIAYVAYLLEILSVIKIHNKEQLKVDIPRMDTRQLLDVGDNLERLYASHLACEAMDRMLAETKELGIEKFKEKYNLSSPKKEDAK